MQTHSEKTIKKLTKNMTGKIVLLAGAASIIGQAILRFFLEVDATVIAPAKSLDDITKMKASVADIKSGTLITQVTELPDYDCGYDLGEAIVEQFGRIDIGIAVFSSLSCNRPLTEVPICDWQGMVDNELTPFFVCARLILPTMKGSQGGLYISVCDSPPVKAENFPPLSKIAANLKMEMSKVFADETKKNNIRYFHLWVNPAAVNVEMIGSRIMKLWLSKSEKPDDIFQLFP